MDTLKEKLERIRNELVDASVHRVLTRPNQQYDIVYGGFVDLVLTACRASLPKEVTIKNASYMTEGSELIKQYKTGYNQALEEIRKIFK